MRFLQLIVRHFGCVRAAEVEFCPGLNVLCGPNDLGKSTLARAMRAVLLVQHGSSVAKDYVEWESDETPFVQLTFQTEEQRIWRIEKHFGEGARGSSILRASRDGSTFTIDEKARAVDDKVRKLLGWGVAGAGGKAAPKGLPPTFLGTVLLGEQSNVVGILDQTLDIDSDDSGRDRLTAALKAFAQDPIFKAILDKAQVKVDEGFTATGRRRRGRDSPFARADEEVEEAQKYLTQLEQQLEKYEVVKRTLEQLHQRRLTAAEGFDTHENTLARMKACAQQAKARSELDEHLAKARSVRWEHEQQLNTVASKGRELSDARQNLGEASVRSDEAGVARAVADERLREAEEAVRRLESDDAARERKLAAEKLRTQDLQLQNERGELGRIRDQALRAVKLERAAADAQGALAALRTKKEELTARQNELAQVLTAIEKDAALLGVVEQLVRREKLESEIEQLESAMTEASADRELAERKRADAAAMIGDEAHILPSEEQLRAIVNLERELKLAEARLGGGITVSVKLKRSIDLKAHADGAARPVDGAEGALIELEAQRKLRLEIGDVALVEVTAGERDVRRNAQELADRWRHDAVPLLENAGVATLEELAARVKRASDVAAQIKLLTDEARRLDERAAIREQGSAKLADRRAELDVLRREFKGADADAAAAIRRELSDANAIDERRRRDRTRTTAMTKELEALRTELTQLDLDASAVQERQKNSVDELSLLAATEGGWTAEIGRIDVRIDEIEDELETIRTGVATLTEQEGQQIAEAKKALAAAEGARDSRAAELVNAGTVVNDLTARIARLSGELDVLAQHARLIDIDAEQRGIADLEARLKELPVPEIAVTDDLLERAERDLDAARRNIADIDAELRKSEGALETVGGEVVRDKVSQAREALLVAQKRERELELEFDAYQLLVNKLREAETTEGQHLGESLSIPVTSRFAALTSGTYGKLELEPKLRAVGVHAAGALREISSLSIGTQEQLATLLRLTIAEYLGCAIVLDDQLTQTDPKRSAWFRKKLKEQAEKSQVIVLTCRPVDYLEDGEIPEEGEVRRDRAAGLVRALNLAAIVKRSTASAPKAHDALTTG